MHYTCLAPVHQPGRSFTNVVVMAGTASSDMERLGHRLGASWAEGELRARARENYDLWGMLIGYSIRVES